jgi:thiol-disulfide isomerase/thioredoxin
MPGAVPELNVRGDAVPELSLSCKARGVQLALLAAIVLLAGCGDGPAGPPDAQDATTAAPTSTSSAAQDAAAATAATDAGAPRTELVPITHARWQERLRSYAPDIVVVDFWATWCIPCLERFPKMIEMAERYRDRGVRFVSMCMEDRDDAPAVAGAERFLTEKRSPLDDYFLDEPLLEGFKDFGLLSIPAVHVYDRSGTLHARLTADDPRKQFDESDVEAAIEALLAP